MSRRTMIGLAGGFGVAAVLGFAGFNWYTHRAVACTINGQSREVPVGAKTSEIVNMNYARPRPGNVVSITVEGEEPQVLVEGGGNPYALTVNGTAVDVDAYRLSENDILEFTNGSDVVEPTTVATTEIPCGIQIPGDSWYLNTVGYVAQWGRVGIATVETGTISGRTIDRGITQEPQDLIIGRSRINPADGRLLVALTFDDGPHLTYTPQYLDILAAYGAKATFFNLGQNIDAGPEYQAMCKRCVDEGHQMASHTYTHDDVTLTGMDDSWRNTEIQETFNSIANATGVATQVLRPPFGELRGAAYLRYLQQQGDIAYSAYWTVDSLDWDVAGRTGLEDGASEIVYNCTRGLSGDNYNGAVILMHDGGGDRSRDVAALPGIIETFQAAGYQFVTMNELLASDPTFPAWVTSGVVTRPEGAIVPDASVEITYLNYDI